LEWRLLQLALSFWLQAQQTAFIPYQTMTSPHNMTAAVCTVALSLEMIPDSLNTAIKTKAITIAFMACNYAHFAGLSKVSRTSFYTSASDWASCSCLIRRTFKASAYDSSVSKANGLTQIKADSRTTLYGCNSAA
jgi:hypothetical protein